MHSPWEEGKQSLAPNPDSFLDFSNSYLPHIKCRSVFHTHYFYRKSCMCYFFLFFCIWYLDVTHRKERPEKLLYCCNSLFLSANWKPELSFVIVASKILNFQCFSTWKTSIPNVLEFTLLHWHTKYHSLFSLQLTVLLKVIRYSNNQTLSYILKMFLQAFHMILDGAKIIVSFITEETSSEILCYL